MILAVTASDSLKGTIRLPASKSYSIRAFIIASCGGTSIIYSPSDCDDAKVAVAVSRQLGACITRSQKNIWKVAAAKKGTGTSRINVKESGTVLRFLLPLLALKGGAVMVVGERTLRSRPNVHLVRTLQAMGVNMSGRGIKQSVPIRIRGGVLQGGRIKIDGSLSSQFISSLLIACPQLTDDTRLIITGKHIVSKDYILMTQQVLRIAGVTSKKIGPRSFHIHGRQKFKGLKKFTVPSDYGLAAFFLAAAALTKSKIILRGYLSDNLIQADKAILGLLRKMGAKFKKTTNAITINGPFCLKGGNFSLKDCPDLVPIMSILALFAEGRTRLYGIQHARIKESNRISDLRLELLKIGARVKEKKGELMIYPRSHYKCNVTLDPHNDHRLAMAFCILGLKIGTRVKDIECVSKSYPGFARDLKRIGVSVIKRRK